MTIHQAVSTGNALIVECVVDTRPDVIEHKNTLGRTALLQAAANGNVTIVKLLVLKGANIAARSYVADNSSMAIHLAAECGHVDVVSFLLDIAFEQLEAKDKDGDTPLARAAYHGRDDVVKYLLSRHADVTSCGYRGRTPLLRAAANGNVSVLKLLVSAGADVTAKSSSADFEKNAVNLAAVFGHVDAVEYLLSLQPDLANSVNMQGDTMICYAALGGHVPVIKFFLEKYSANMETLGRSGRTPLLQSASMGHLEAVKFFVSRGANVLARSRSDDGELTVLHLAAKFGHVDVVAYLLSIKPELAEAVDSQLHTAFDVAKSSNRKAVLEYFDKKKSFTPNSIDA